MTVVKLGAGLGFDTKVLLFSMSKWNPIHLSPDLLFKRNKETPFLPISEHWPPIQNVISTNCTLSIASLE